MYFKSHFISRYTSNNPYNFAISFTQSSATIGFFISLYTGSMKISIAWGICLGFTLPILSYLHSLSKQLRNICILHSILLERISILSDLSVGLCPISLSDSVFYCDGPAQPIQAQPLMGPWSDCCDIVQLHVILILNLMWQFIQLSGRSLWPLACVLATLP